MKTALIYIVKLYKLIISPHLGNNCRFTPTCSEYTIIAIETHGALKGSYLGFKRILRCNPFTQGGVDFPPQSTCKEHTHGNG